MSRINYFSANSIFHMIYDFMVLIVAYVVSVELIGFIYPTLNNDGYIWLVVITAPIWLLLMNMMNIYEKIVYFSFQKIIRIVLVSSLSSTLVLIGMSSIVKKAFQSKKIFVTYIIVSMVLMLVFKCIFKYMSSKEKAVLSNTARVIIVGNQSYAKELNNYTEQFNLGLNLIGYVHINAPISDYKDKDLGSIENIVTIIKENSIDEVIFALPKFYNDEIEKYVLQCEEMGIVVRMVLDLYDLQIARTYLSNVGTISILTFDTLQFTRFQLFIKRLMDIIGSLIGIFITMIVALFLIIIIKIDSPGPAIFSQNRVGLNGRKFKLFKFRSMCIDAENLKEKLQSQNMVMGGLMFKIQNDPRTTKVGRIIRKTSLDELPQFWNVLIGEMSLVGTRPPTVDEVSKYENYQRRRISIKPGLTGMWQVHGRSSIKDFDEVVKLDIKYIDEWSIWLDVKLILKTILVMLGKKSGAY